MTATSPDLGVILHAVGGGDEPAVADERGPADVAVGLDVQADLPRELAGQRLLTPHDARGLEQTPPTICGDSGVQRSTSGAALTEVAVKLSSGMRLEMVKLRYEARDG